MKRDTEMEMQKKKKNDRIQLKNYSKKRNQEHCREDVHLTQWEENYRLNIQTLTLPIQIISRFKEL